LIQIKTMNSKSKINKVVEFENTLKDLTTTIKTLEAELEIIRENNKAGLKLENSQNSIIRISNFEGKVVLLKLILNELLEKISRIEYILHQRLV